MQATVTSHTNDNPQSPLFPRLEGKVFGPEIYGGNGRVLLKAIKGGLASDPSFLEKNGALLLKEAKSALHKNLIALVMVDTLTTDSNSLRSAVKQLLSLEQVEIAHISEQAKSIVTFSRGIPAIILIAKTWNETIVGIMDSASKHPNTLH